MDVGLSPEQMALRASAGEVLRAECPPDVARRAITDSATDPNYWRALWKTVTGLGWTELADPGADGAFGAVELAVVAEACGAAVAPIPLLASVGMAAGLLRRSGSALDWVREEIAAGTVAALAVHPAGRRLPGVPMTLRSGRLSGRAVGVSWAAHADFIVTLADSGDGPVAAAVRAEDALIGKPGECIDPAHPLTDVELDASPAVVAPVDVEMALATPLVVVAADLVGVADAALTRSVQHAKTRRQFGKPIGAFQGVKHALADNYVALERARSLSYAAAARLDDPDTGPAAAWTAAAAAKAAAGEAALGCVRTAVQVHGAIAQTWEHNLHLVLRHAWQAAALLGDSRALYDALGRRFIEGVG